MDYHRHFGLSKRPFDMVGQPTSLYMSKSHREGLAALEWGLLHEPGNFTLLMGEVGTGKTTLITVLLGRHYDLARIAYVMNPKLGFEEMLRVILEQLGYLPSVVTKLELLRKFEWVLGQLRPKERIAIIVDEAQALSDETLEELRLFSNYGRQSVGHLEILLVGQPELLTRLMAPSLRQFHQRIGARAVLNPLQREEAFEYIDYKLREAVGTAQKIFAKRALKEIVAHSQGVPRQLNLLCNNALIRAYAADLRRVSVKVARAAINEYENLGGTAEDSREPLARQILRSITARLAIPLTGLGLVALAGLYSLGVRGMPGTELMFRGATKSVVSTDVGQKREATVNAAPRISTGSHTDALQNVVAVGEALIQSLPPTGDSEASKRAVTGLTILRTSRTSSPTKHVTVARLEPTSALTPNEHLHDTLSKIVVPHLAVSTPKARKKRVAMVPRDSNGWYIFLPPSDPQHRSPDLSAPFKRWARDESFGSAEDCEDYRARVISEAASDRDRADGPTDALDYRIKLFSYAECVSDQDQRIADRPHALEHASLTGSERPGDGWYIFLPPGDALHRSPDPSAPFRRWTQGEAFDTAEGCKDYREREVSDAASDRDRADGPTDTLDYRIKLFSYAECVSAQDRRIKEERF